MVVIEKIGQLVTMQGAIKKQGRRIEHQDLGIITDACLVFDKKIQWVGRQSDLPAKFKKSKKINARGKLVMPGLVDSHTHLVFAGDRSCEFEMRLAGRTYQEIALAGGGILKTMKSTREIKKTDLLKLSLERLECFLSQGITTVEIKTGYGLDFDSEKKCLEIISELKKKSKATIKAAYLAAHAVPPEFKGRKSEYVKELSQKWLPKLKSHCDYVDIFVDEGYFDTKDAQVLVNAAKKFKIPIKIHADEIKLTGGTEFACHNEALSADHLLQISQNEIDIIAKSETTATLLPTTAFFLKTDYAPARRLLDAGARVALATDFNPGTSPTQDVSLVGALSALHMNMRTEEIITGLTLNGAYALGLQKQKGALMPGFDADLAMFEAESVAQVFYEFGKTVSNKDVFVSGKRV